MLIKVISGGQTGADRAGLDAARDADIETGGWATKGYLIQTPEGQNVSDLSLKDFGLIEMPTPAYPPRTKANVRDSDGTIWFGFGSSPGGKITLGEARKLNRPVIEFTLKRKPNPWEFFNWLEKHQIETLNVAGNRQSEWNPDIYDKVYRFLSKAFVAYQLAEESLSHPAPITQEDAEWADQAIRIARKLESKR